MRQALHSVSMECRLAKEQWQGIEEVTATSLKIHLYHIILWEFEEMARKVLSIIVL